MDQNKKPMLDQPGMLFEMLQNNAVILQYLVTLFEIMMRGYKNIDVILTNLRTYCLSLDAGPSPLILSYLLTESAALRACIAELPSDREEIQQIVKAYWLTVCALRGQSPEDILIKQDAGGKGKRLDYRQAWRMYRILSHKIDPLTRTIKEVNLENQQVLLLLDTFNQAPDPLQKRDWYQRVIEPSAAFVATHDAFLDSLTWRPPTKEYVTA